MKNYKHVLVAVALIPKSDVVVVEQAKKIASDFGADISLVHVIEYTFDYTYIHDYGSHSIGIGFGVENTVGNGESSSALECARDDYGAHSISLDLKKPKDQLMDESNILLERVRKEMIQFGSNVGIHESKIITEIGTAKFVILDVAERLGSDLIVIGNHGKHGLHSILGSTANAILHGAKCDSLVVRLAE